MSDHTPLRAAAITEAARTAGAIDPNDAAIFIPASETLTPSEAVAALKLTKPHLFGPPDARTMKPGDYAAAKRKMLRRHALAGR